MQTLDVLVGLFCLCLRLDLWEKSIQKLYLRCEILDVLAYSFVRWECLSILEFVQKLLRAIWSKRFLKRIRCGYLAEGGVLTHLVWLYPIVFITIDFLMLYHSFLNRHIALQINNRSYLFILDKIIFGFGVTDQINLLLFWLMLNPSLFRFIWGQIDRLQENLSVSFRWHETTLYIDCVSEIVVQLCQCEGFELLDRI